MPVTPPEQTVKGRRVLDAITLANAALERQDDQRAGSFYNKNARIINPMTFVITNLPVRPGTPQNPATPAELAAWQDQIAALYPAGLEVLSMEINGNLVEVRGAVTLRDNQGNPTGETRRYLITFRVTRTQVEIIRQMASGG